MSGTPAAASALAGLYAGMGEAEKAAGVVVKAAEAARRGDHVSVYQYTFFLFLFEAFYLSGRIYSIPHGLDDGSLFLYLPLSGEAWGRTG